jgi:ADP-ribose pyrophosphatase
MIEFPAGKLDAGEDPLLAAQRELREETGYTATHWQHFHTHHPTIAYSTERIEFFIARGLQAGPRALDEGERIDTMAVSAARLRAWLREGALTDGKTVAGLLLALDLGLLDASDSSSP